MKKSTFESLNNSKFDNKKISEAQMQEIKGGGSTYWQCMPVKTGLSSILSPDDFNGYVNDPSE